jgi:hypothetical protein
VAALAAGVVAAWWAIGDDATGVTHAWALVASGAFAILAVLTIVPLLAGVVATVRATRATTPRRPGTARAVLAAVIAIGALGGTAALIIPSVAQATDEQDKEDQRKAASVRSSEGTATKADREAEGQARWGAQLRPLDPGACLTWPEGPTVQDRLQNSAEILTAKTVPCSEPHAYEVLGTANAGGGDRYPGAAVLIGAAQGPCEQLLLDYLTPKGGTRPTATAWGAYGVAPAQGTWERFPDQRGVRCIAIPPRFGAQRTGTLAGAG